MAKCDPRHQPSQASAFLENWHTSSLVVSQAAHEAPGPVATPFEYYIQSSEATKYTMKLNMPPRHPIKSARCNPYETKIGQHTDEPVHYMPGESRVLPLLRLATATTPCYVFQTPGPNGP